MDRVGMACLLAAAVVLGAVKCTSSEPGQPPSDSSSNLSTAVSEVTAPGCYTCSDIHLSEYNLFLLEDFTSTGTIQGKLAVGGNVSLSDFSVGTALLDHHIDTSNTLVAGGNLTLARGMVAGDIRYGGSYTSSQVGLSTGATVAQGRPIANFAEEFAALVRLSTRLAAPSSNGTTEAHSWGVTMTGGNGCLNVFTLNASDFTGGGVWTIDAPADSFVLVNVFGQAPTYRGGNIQLVGINSRRVLFNFVDATLLTVASFSFKGTVLAPKAAVTIQETGMEGGIYARSLSLRSAPANLSPLARMPGAQAEVCNGVDDTCDGQVDEGFECPGSSSRSCTAWCGAEGTQTCDSATCGYGECTSASCCHADADCSSGSYCSGNTCVERQGNGASCGNSNQCASGQCVDGVCCNTACDGECNACNLAGHEGTCTLVPATTQCRGSAGACDVAEYCTGTDNDCPVDGYASSATQCRAANGVCDVAEHCTGAAAACPGDAVASAGTLCRAAAGSCDVAEVCDGTQKSCPGDGYASPGTSCGTSYGSWSTCGGFSDFCSTRGTQSRTVTSSTCGGAGVCGASSTSTETQACTRPAPDTSCQAPSYGA